MLTVNTINTPHFSGNKSSFFKKAALLPLLVLGTTLPARSQQLKQDVFTSIDSAQQRQDTVNQQFYRLLNDYVQDWSTGRLLPRLLENYYAQLDSMNHQQLAQEDRAYRMLFLNDVQWRLHQHELNADTTNHTTPPASSNKRKKQLAPDKQEALSLKQPDSIMSSREYDALLKHRGFVNLDASALIALAQNDFNRIEQKMDSLARTILPDAASWRDVYEEIRKNHPSRDQVIPAYQREVVRAEKFIEEKNLFDIPEGYPIYIVETPPDKRHDYPFAAYFPSSMTFSVTVTMDDNPANQDEQLRNNNYGDIATTTVHEAMPGHHLERLNKKQNLQENKLPSTNPHSRGRRFLLKSGCWDPKFYIEGWGLYGEVLMLREGYYNQAAETQDPASMQLTAMKDILWRAARALLDPQIHTGKITPEEAVDFLSEKLLMDRDRAIAEVNRYVEDPLEVTSYYLGMRQIMETWKNAREQSPGLTLQEFHQQVLKQTLPVPVLAMKYFGVTLKDTLSIDEILSPPKH